MNLEDVIRLRKSYRELEEIEVSKELMLDLAGHAALAPSCFNNQPWRFIFVHDKKQLVNLFSTLSSGNAWAKKASIIIAVVSKEDLDCITRKGEMKYYEFDCGLATSLLLLRATELGLVAHVIAGFREKEAKQILKVPNDMKIIALIVVGGIPDFKLTRDIKDLSALRQELKKRDRKDLEEIVFFNTFSS